MFNNCEVGKRPRAGRAAPVPNVVTSNLRKYMESKELLIGAYPRRAGAGLSVVAPLPQRPGCGCGGFLAPSLKLWRHATGRLLARARDLPSLLERGQGGEAASPAAGRHCHPLRSFPITAPIGAGHSFSVSPIPSVCLNCVIGALVTLPSSSVRGSFVS